jgi:hypothetical protein
MTSRGWIRGCAALVAVLMACGDGGDERAGPPESANVTPAPVCDARAVREVVTRLGDRLSDVSLLAPDAAEQLRAAYESLVTPQLLAAWVAEPTRAPGRAVSSPSPDRIEVGSVSAAGADTCRVEGEVVYLTSADPIGGEGSSETIVVTVSVNGEPRITDYQRVAPPAESNDDTAAMVDVIERYYAAIAARDYRSAYDFWPSGSEPNRQTYDQFAAGFAETESVAVEVGEPGRVEAAAGSRYVDVPVTIRARARSGVEQRFQGSYTLRRSVADGASAAQQMWHLYSASITPSP